MKKILLTLIYPFWYFLSKTWIGAMLMICITPLIPAFIIMMIFPSIRELKGDAAEGVGGGLAIFSLMCSPYIAMPIMALGIILEMNYEKWGYKI